MGEISLAMLRFLTSFLAIIVVFTIELNAIEVSGMLTANTTWNNTSEPYVIDNFNGPVIVPAGVKLTIVNGVTVTNKFDNKGSIIVNGELQASLATFEFTTSASNGGGKHPLIVSESGTATFTDCRFTTSDSTVSLNTESRVVSVTDSASVTISGCTFSTNNDNGQATYMAIWTGDNANLSVAASGKSSTSFTGYPIAIYIESSGTTSLSNIDIQVAKIGLQLRNGADVEVTDSSMTANTSSDSATGIEYTGSAALTLTNIDFTNLTNGISISETAIGATSIQLNDSNFMGNETAVENKSTADLSVTSGTFTSNKVGLLLNGPANLTLSNSTFTDHDQAIRALQVELLSLDNVTVGNTEASDSSVGLYTDQMSAFSATDFSIARQKIGLRLDHANLNTDVSGISFSENQQNVFLEGEFSLGTVSAEITLPVGRYILDNSTGPIVIEENGILNIQPGSEILNLTADQNVFQIQGTINATKVMFDLTTISSANESTGAIGMKFVGNGSGFLTNCMVSASDVESATNSRIIQLHDTATLVVAGCKFTSSGKHGFITSTGVAADGTAKLEIKGSSGNPTTFEGFNHGVYWTSNNNLLISDSDFTGNQTGLHFSSSANLILKNSTFTMNTWGISLREVGVLVTENTSVTDNINALFLTWKTVRKNLSGLTLADNSFDSYLVASQTIVGAQTMPVMHYHLDVSDGPIVVPEASTLNLEPGTKITNVAGDMRKALVSGAIQDNETSGIEITKTITEGRRITFDYATSSQASRDVLEFNVVDGANTIIHGVNLEGGDTPWKSYSLFLDRPGLYTFRWRYKKNESISQFRDQVMIDNVRFPDGTIERFDTSIGLDWKESADSAAIWRVQEVMANSSGQLGSVFEVAGTLNVNDTTLDFTTQHEANNGQGTIAFDFTANATGSFTDCVITTSDISGQSNSRILNLADSASVILSSCQFADSAKNGFKTQYGIFLNDNSTLTIDGDGANGNSSFSGFPTAIHSSDLFNITLSKTDFEENDHGIFYAGTFTLNANHTLLPAQMTFENPLVVPESYILTIPLSAKLQNYKQRTLLNIQGQVIAEGVSFDLVTDGFLQAGGGTQTLEFSGNATGSFTDCRFSSSDIWPNSNIAAVSYNRHFYPIECEPYRRLNLESLTAT